jgi:Flp pilus assembly protein protease CpaA
MPFVIAISLTAYLIVAAVWDLRTMHVPNWLTLPVLVAVFGWRVFELEFAFVPFWVGSLIAWHLNAIGGGDAKVLMILFGFFPNATLFYLFLIVAGVELLIVLVLRYARAGSLHVLARRLAFQVSRLDFFPTSEEIEMNGEPFTFFISLAGIIYIWVFATGV